MYPSNSVSGIMIEGSTAGHNTPTYLLTRVSSFPLGLEGSLHSRARVNDLWLPDDQTVLHQLPHVLTRVGVGYFGGFIRVEPYLALPTL